MAEELKGDCPFCEQKNVTIINSHIIPRWAHKRTRGDGSKGDPIIVYQDKSVQSGEQLAEPMLCSECDQTLGVFDKYAADLAYHRGTAGILKGCSIHSEPGESTMLGVLDASIDVDRLSRFAASVFWRGHIAKRTAKCDIGERHAQTLLRYLRREARFPCTLTLIAQVFVPDGPRRFVEGEAAWEPTTKAEEGSRVSDFMVCGLLFRLESGSARSEELNAICLQNTKTRTVAVTPSGRAGYLKRIAAAPAVGRGARRLAGLE